MDDAARPTWGTTHLDEALSGVDFSERHRRVIQAPGDRAWAAALTVTAREVRLLAPLMAVRSLPRIVTGRWSRGPKTDRPMLDGFAALGFVELHRDPGLVEGHACTVHGAVGRFWSPSRNQPEPLDGRPGFLASTRPGMVKTAFSLEVVDRGTSAEIITETRIVGTDARARRTFGIYWLIIRGPSGLIRRSWLAAIDRRATADPSSRAVRAAR
jgi:hypothetical protein